MSGRPRSQTMFVVLALSALTLMTLDLRDGGDGPVAGLQAGALGLFAPVQHAVSLALRPVTAATAWVDDQRDLHAQLRQQRALAADRDRLLAERDDARAENAELRRLLALREHLGVRTVAAQVLGSVPGDPGTSVLITAGADDGVAPDMVVLDARGVVGRVSVAGAGYARVELVTSPRARYAVRVVAGGVSGRLHGRGDGGMQVELDDADASVPAGATVVTRAFEGSAVPDGIAIGTLAAGSAGSAGSGSSGGALAVRPIASLASLGVVEVVLSEPQPRAVPSPEPAAAVPLPEPARPSER